MRLIFLFCFIALGCHVLADDFVDQDVVSWQSDASWTEGRFPYEGCLNAFSYVTRSHRCLFFGRLKASGGCFYPQINEDSAFNKQVNQIVSQNAKSVFSEWISNTSQEEMEEKELDPEAIDMAFDRREFCYKLTPVYISSKFISIFGEINRFSGLPHGSSSYVCLNFWWDGRQVRRVILEHMVNCNESFAAFLSSYCKRFLKEYQISYFSEDDEFSTTLEIQLKDCDVVSVSEKGLIFTFQPYTVGGWADGPYSVTLPFKELINFIISDGPISDFVSSVH